MEAMAAEVSVMVTGPAAVEVAAEVTTGLLAEATLLEETSLTEAASPKTASKGNAAYSKRIFEAYIKMRK